MNKLIPLNQKVELSVLSEMEMLQVYGGSHEEDDSVTNNCYDGKCGYCVEGCGSSGGSSSGSSSGPAKYGCYVLSKCDGKNSI